MQKFKVTKVLAKKVLETVDKGLCSGLGQPEPGQMCVEAAVCFAMGLPHGDEPTCVSPAIRSLKIGLNDSGWSTNDARAKGMRRLAIAQLGTAEVINDKEFVKALTKLTITKVLPRALRYATSIHPELEHKKALEDAAIKCEKEGTKSAAWSAAWSAKSAAESAAWSVAESAKSAAESAKSVAQDKELALFAEEVVQILIKLKAPGTKFLYLTE